MMPFIPEFKQATERNQWIVENASYFTVIRRYNRCYQREECPTFDAAEQFAQRIIKHDPSARFLIYAVAGQHDALTATISNEGTKRHQ
jgi:hypothetical protein